MKQKEIKVYAHWKELKKPVLMGVLSATPSRGKEIFLFQYTDEWLRSASAQLIDPDLGLFSGAQYPTSEKNNFGIFLDSAPDRWGRMLMRRREAVMARNENRREETLLESDYLLGVYDGHRMGALRFKLVESGQFLNDNQMMATPPWSTLRAMEHASSQLERDDITDDPQYVKWLNMLLFPGSSLGGARPKAGIIDEKNHLWIAKFPSRNDDINIGAWEMVVHELAIKAGVNVAKAMIQKFSTKHHTFLTKRFDRTSKGERIHFASAMTMLGYNDGTDHHDGVSYLELAEFIIQHGANVKSDLHELWRRIVFNICVKNTDDHLRNHGFLLTDQGWMLAPAYDMNPVSTGTGLKLNISENDNSLNPELALEVAEYFRLTKKEAILILQKVKKSVMNWKDIAKGIGINKSEQEQMNQAFWKDSF